MPICSPATANRWARPLAWKAARSAGGMAVPHAGQQGRGDSPTRAWQCGHDALGDRLAQVLPAGRGGGRDARGWAEREPVAAEAGEEGVPLCVPAARVGWGRWRAQQGAHDYAVAGLKGGGVRVPQADTQGARQSGGIVQAGGGECHAAAFGQDVHAGDLAGDDGRAAGQVGPGGRGPGGAAGAGKAGGGEGRAQACGLEWGRAREKAGRGEEDRQQCGRPDVRLVRPGEVGDHARGHEHRQEQDEAPCLGQRPGGQGGGQFAGWGAGGHGRISGA